ncbi:MAG: Gfo/Idh/MocA family oxidoreductase, partial [Candidatus Eremiobacteraeota bacterium]|nr:Gfo/Idh/MocA family oxidoreductase [Candidatus Eremiobacteraeota bacterium]
MTPSLGLIGAGYWGSNLLRNAAAMGCLRAVCDRSEEIRARVRAQFPALEVYAEVECLLDSEIDAVVIAAPAQEHAELAIRALERGKHVFVEKPLALSLSDGRAIVESGKHRGLIVFVGHLLLYHPAIRELLRAVRDGAIGEVRHLRARRVSLGKVRSHEDVWWSFAPHDVAVMLEILAEEPVSARGALSSFTQPPLADFAYADFAFPRGKTAHLEVSWLDPQKNQRLDVFGSRGVLTFEDARTGSALTLTPCGTVATALAIDVHRSDARSLEVPGG